MKEFENNFYEFDEEEQKLKFFSDEFEKLMSKCDIKLNNIELDIETCNIYCYIDIIDYTKLNCKKFDKILKNKIPYIEDVILEEGYFVLIFNIEKIELF